ncbi:MAG: lipoprotein [Candidatus Peribacteria bacterium]|nr:lipoprotein [Candidatus Peribacteria bacterium]
MYDADKTQYSFPMKPRHFSLVAFTAISLVFTMPSILQAQNDPLNSSSADNASAALSQPKSEFERGKVLAITKEVPDNFAGIDRTVQTVHIKITAGPDTGKEFDLENGVLGNRNDMRLSVGETVVLEKLEKSDGNIEYQVREKYRLPAVLYLGLFFVVLAFAFGGITGLTSLLGLVVSVFILMFFVIPKIVAGSDPLTVCLIASFAIACTSLYLAHGFHKRTTVALISTLVTLAISAILAVSFVHIAKLFGMGSEESMFLQYGVLDKVDLRGLLLGGIIIGCLGVLDDVTTAQTAAIDEIGKANPNMSYHDLRKAGMSVGKEHIASLINTLALAYVGASLPLLLLFKVQADSPAWVVLNSEFLAEEIIRTLVGSSTLLFAVPISTWLAAYLLRNDRNKKFEGRGHSHHHGH